MFRRISYIIALQFTGFVFVLFLLNGFIFLSADFRNARHQTEFRLTRSLELVINRTREELVAIPRKLPPMIRERLRITDALGMPVFTGSFFTDIPFSERQGLSRRMIDGEQYGILTTTLIRDGRVIGYVQLADIERFEEELPLRLLLYLFVSGVISALTFFVGLFFAKRSLAPAVASMRKLEQFTQDASHELRTPLAVVNSSLDLALKTKKYREGIESAKEDLKRISLLTERLMELARLDAFTIKRDTVDLSAATQQIVERFKLLAAEKSLEITADIAPGVTVKGDETLIGQVLGNLLTNAIKFNKPGGKIHVRLTPKELAVEDTGVGIAAAALPHLFDRFYRADESRSTEGLGLGLALVKRIVDLHGWKVNARNRVEGAIFTVTF